MQNLVDQHIRKSSATIALELLPTAELQAQLCANECVLQTYANECPANAAACRPLPRARPPASHSSERQLAQCHYGPAPEPAPDWPCEAFLDLETRTYVSP
jgi:hypothetical protein